MFGKWEFCFGNYVWEPTVTSSGPYRSSAGNGPKTPKADTENFLISTIVFRHRIPWTVRKFFRLPPGLRGSNLFHGRTQRMIPLSFGIPKRKRCIFSNFLLQKNSPTSADDELTKFLDDQVNCRDRSVSLENFPSAIDSFQLKVPSLNSVVTWGVTLKTKTTSRGNRIGSAPRCRATASSSRNRPKRFLFQDPSI